MMKHRNKAIKVALFFCVMPISLEISSCSIHDTYAVNTHSWTKDVNSLVKGKANAKFWSKVRPHSNLADAHWRLGGFYQRQGKYELAIDEFSKALNVDEGLCKAYNGIAMSYDGLKKCDLAHKTYEIAINCDPEEAYIYNNYGYSCILCNQLEKGTALLLRAEELSGGSEQIKNNLELARLVGTRQLAPDRDNSLPGDSGLDLATATPREIATHMALAAEQEQTLAKPVELDAEVEAVAEQDAPEVVEQPSVVLVPSVGANFQPQLLLDDFEVAEIEEVTLPAETSVAAVNNGRVLKPVLKPAKKRPVVATEKTAVSIETEAGKADAKPAPPSTSQIILPLPGDSARPKDNSEVQSKNPKEAELDDKSQALYQKSETGVEVSNGNGVTGMARRSSRLLGNYGFKVRRLTNARNFNFDESVIYYRDGYLGVAQELSHFLPGDQKLEEVDSLGRAAIGVRVLLGSDLVMIDFPEHFTRLSYMQLEEGKPGVWKDLVKLTMDE